MGTDAGNDFVSGWAGRANSAEFDRSVLMREDSSINGRMRGFAVPASTGPVADNVPLAGAQQDWPRPKGSSTAALPDKCRTEPTGDRLLHDRPRHHRVWVLRPTYAPHPLAPSEKQGQGFPILKQDEGGIGRDHDATCDPSDATKG